LSRIIAVGSFHQYAGPGKWGKFWQKECWKVGVVFEPERITGVGVCCNRQQTTSGSAASAAAPRPPGLLRSSGTCHQDILILGAVVRRRRRAPLASASPFSAR